MNALTNLAETTGVKEADIIHAARGVADVLVKHCGDDVDKAIELMRGADAGEIAAAMLQDYVKQQRALAIRALTRSEKFAQLIAYKLVDRTQGLR